MEFIKYQQKVLKSERAVGCEVDDNRVLISHVCTREIYKNF